MRWQNATLTRIARLSPAVKSFFFTLPTPVSFIAGQHVTVRLTAADGYRAQRSYSIASAPETAAEGIELAIERLDDGEVSPFFHDIAEEGDEIEISRPVGGHFIWSPGDGGPVLLIGAGAGLAPLMSMIRNRAASGAEVPMTLLFSARAGADFLYGDELLGLDGRKDGFQLRTTFTRDPKARGDYFRRVDADMVRDVLDRMPAPPRHVLICGSNAFVDTAADGVVGAGITPTLVRTERYGA